MAEADTAPLNSLVSKPIPFHGSHVRTMESGGPEFDDRPAVSFKGHPCCPDNYAILVYPGKPNPGKRTWLTSKSGVLIRTDDWTAVFRSPTSHEIREKSGKPF